MCLVDPRCIRIPVPIFPYPIRICDTVIIRLCNRISYYRYVFHNETGNIVRYKVRLKSSSRAWTAIRRQSCRNVRPNRTPAYPPYTPGQFRKAPPSINVTWRTRTSIPVSKTISPSIPIGAWAGARAFANLHVPGLSGSWQKVNHRGKFDDYIEKRRGIREPAFYYVKLNVLKIKILDY